jgi:hypothetical protein
MVRLGAAGADRSAWYKDSLMRSHVSPELEIVRAPGAAFSRLTAERHHVSLADACYRPAVAALTIGTAASISSTSHVSIALVSTVTACWAFLVGIQVAAAWLVMPGGAGRARTPARAIDLLFSGHAPWSLWLLACAALSVLLPVSARDSRLLLVSMAVPMAWNAVIVFAFFRNALGLSRCAALRRTAAHQAMTVGTGLALFGSLVGIWPRIVGVFVR